MSDEDIIPLWLIKFLLKKLGLIGKDAAKFKRSLGWTVPTCIDCNNTWMSTLENDVKDVFLAMFKQTRMLDRNEQELLAKWAVMKAILMDAAQENLCYLEASDTA